MAEFNGCLRLKIEPNKVSMAAKLYSWRVVAVIQTGPIYFAIMDYYCLCAKARPCLVDSENQKVFKILYHIESFVICMKH